MGEVMRDFEFLREIGSGRDGNVFCVRSKSSDQLFALKVGDSFTVSRNEFAFTRKSHSAAGIGPYAFKFFSEMNSETGASKNSILMEYIEGDCIDKYPVSGSILSEILDNYYGLGVHHSVWQNDLKASNVLCRRNFNINCNGDQFCSKGIVLIDYGIASSSCTPTDESSTSSRCMEESDSHLNGATMEPENSGMGIEEPVTIITKQFEFQYQHMVKMVSLFIQSLVFPQKYCEFPENSNFFVLSLNINSKTRYLNSLIFHGYNWLMNNFGRPMCKLSVDISSKISPEIFSCSVLNSGNYSTETPKTPSIKKVFRRVFDRAALPVCKNFDSNHLFSSFERDLHSSQLDNVVDNTTVNSVDTCVEIENINKANPQSCSTSIALGVSVDLFKRRPRQLTFSE